MICFKIQGYKVNDWVSCDEPIRNKAKCQTVLNSLYKFVSYHFGVKKKKSQHDDPYFILQ